MAYVLIKRSPQRLRHIGRRLPDDEVRDQGDASLNQGMVTTVSSDTGT